MQNSFPLLSFSLFFLVPGRVHAITWDEVERTEEGDSPFFFPPSPLLLFFPFF